MIRVDKPNPAPAILLNRGKTTTEANNAAFDADPDAYRNGGLRFRFDNTLYGAKSVKNALIKAQHGKCAFCESKITHIDFGDVEHFRPKGGTRQSDAEPMALPGYYWLAYVWENLFLACSLCNQRFKKNFFPLADPAKRAQSHRDDVGAEAALFIDPAQDAPEECIGFREEIAFPINDDPRGRATIEALGLNRPELSERRFDHHRMLATIRNLLRLLPPESDDALDARAVLDAAVRDDAQYASMARHLLGAGRQPVRRFTTAARRAV
jgi:uncharacterized protein (TIGR02646 family)